MRLGRLMKAAVTPQDLVRALRIPTRILYQSPNGRSDLPHPMPNPDLRLFFGSKSPANSIQAIKKVRLKVQKAQVEPRRHGRLHQPEAGMPMHIDDHPYPTKTPLKGILYHIPEGRRLLPCFVPNTKKGANHSDWVDTNQSAESI